MACRYFREADARIRTADPFITRHRNPRDARARAGTRGHDRPAHRPDRALPEWSRVDARALAGASELRPRARARSIDRDRRRSPAAARRPVGDLQSRRVGSCRNADRRGRGIRTELAGRLVQAPPRRSNRRKADLLGAGLERGETSDVPGRWRVGRPRDPQAVSMGSTGIVIVPCCVNGRPESPVTCVRRIRLRDVADRPRSRRDDDRPQCLDCCQAAAAGRRRGVPDCEQDRETPTAAGLAASTTRLVVTARLEPA